MKHYAILHSSVLNKDKELDVTFNHVATVKAVSMKHAFAKAKNHNPDYKKLGIRNTSVGDVIRLEGEFNMIDHDYEFRPVCLLHVNGGEVTL